MKQQSFRTYEELSKKGARTLYEQILQKPNSTIIVGGGSSPRLLYDEFVELAKKNHLNVSEVTWIKLDEWMKMTKEDPLSIEYFLQEHLYRPLDILPTQIIGFDPGAQDYDYEIKKIKYLLPEHIDLAILGVGKNGHIGINEPEPTLQVSDRISHLAESSKTQSSLQNGGWIESGMTLGLKTIFKSAHIMLLITGAQKDAALEALLKRRIDPAWPCTVLALHPHTDVLIDESALQNN